MVFYRAISLYNHLLYIYILWLFLFQVKKKKTIVLSSSSQFFKYWWKKNEIMQIWNNLTNFSHQNKHQTAYKKNYMIKFVNQNKINVGIGKFYLCWTYKVIVTFTYKKLKHKMCILTLVKISNQIQTFFYTQF
jgi:hypothetical protein